MAHTYIDLIIRIKNGYQAQKETVEVRYSTFSKTILAVLKKEGYIKDFSPTKDKKEIEVTLLYKDGVPALSGVEIISTPGRKMYQRVSDIRSVRGGLGTAIVTTNKGIYTDREAHKLKVGGEVLYTIW